jgi:hypothetical protein
MQTEVFLGRDRPASLGISTFTRKAAVRWPPTSFGHSPVENHADVRIVLEPLDEVAVEPGMRARDDIDIAHRYAILRRSPAQARQNSSAARRMPAGRKRSCQRLNAPTSWLSTGRRCTLWQHPTGLSTRTAGYSSADALPGQATRHAFRSVMVGALVGRRTRSRGVLRRKSHDHIAEAISLGAPDASFRAPLVVNHFLTCAAALASTPICYDGNARDVPHQS